MPFRRCLYGRTRAFPTSRKWAHRLRYVLRSEFNGGKVRGLTTEGKAFVRDIENDRVWELYCKTLGESGLDLSHPLLKKVSETVVERYVMSKIPGVV